MTSRRSVLIDPLGSKLPSADVAREIKDLSGELAATPPKLTRRGEPKITKDIATTTVQVEWALPGQTRWAYDREVRLAHGDDDQWQVIWEPKVVHEQLTKGDRLALRRDAGARAAVLDNAGKPLVTPRPVVRVGVQPNAVTDLKKLVKDLDAAFKAIRPALVPGVDLADLPDRVAKAEPGAFVEVVSLREEAYLQIKPRIYDLPGTKFISDKLDLAPTREFARALLGTVDQAQADDLAAHPDRYVVGDLVGHGGLQGRYDERLRGGPGLTVVVERPAEGGKLEPTGAELFRREPQPGQALKTTLDVAVQNAADGALRAEPRRSALVAIRISDGAVLAAANGPGPAGENLAFDAQVPPGSTFKMVSTLGLLDRGAVTLDGPVDCKKTFTVDGRSFKNSDNFELGSVPFRTDFAKSCNTAFAALAPKLGGDGLAAAGRALGLEGQWDLGTDAFTGKVSTGGSLAEQAAASFGQGTTLVSPLAMAGATAAVARGRFEQPKLLLDPAPAKPAAGRRAAQARVRQGAAHDDARGGHRRHRQRAQGCAGRGVRQDRHRRVRRQPGAHPRLVRRLAGRRGVRRLRGEGRGQHRLGRPDGRALPPRPPDRPDPTARGLPGAGAPPRGHCPGQRRRTALARGHARRPA